MGSHAHKKLIQQIARLDEVPEDTDAFNEWIKADAHIDFLATNAVAHERVIFAAGPYSYVHSIVVPDTALAEDTQEALMQWSARPDAVIASYVWGGGREVMWIDRDKHYRGSSSLDAGKDLFFGRTFEGWSGADRNYYEINQEYAHLSVCPETY